METMHWLIPSPAPWTECCVPGLAKSLVLILPPDPHAHCGGAHGHLADEETLRDLCEVTEARAGLEAPPGSLDARCHAQDRMLSDTYGMTAALTGPSWGFCVAPCTTPSTVPG